MTTHRRFYLQAIPHGIAALLICGSLLFADAAHAVILYGTDDPTANTTAPTGALAGSGWQYEGQFAGFLGTPIAPNYFITAAHIGGASLVGTSIEYQGTSYTTTAAYTEANSDLCIYRISGTFSTYAPLYTNLGGEVGQGLVVFGRGTQRGSPVLVGSTQQLGGWMWGTSDGVQRWGQNTVSQIYTDPTLGNLLYAPFSQQGGPDEATLSVGDSGGGVFVQGAGGVWALAGINYGVDGPFYTSSSGAGGFNAAMFDTTGLYESDGTNYVAANNPSGFYATDIAANLAFINGVVPEPASVWMVSVTAGVSLTAWALRTRRHAG